MSGRLCCCIVAGAAALLAVGVPERSAAQTTRAVRVARAASPQPLVVAAAQCPLAIDWLEAVVPQTPAADAVATAVVGAKRAFSLLDIAAARAQLDPVLAQLRREHRRGRWRSEAELLAARIADLEGDQPAYRDAIRALAELKLFGELDAAAMPPTIVRDVTAARRATWLAGVVDVTVVPAPSTVAVDGHVLTALPPFELPLGLGEPVRLTITWPDVGTVELPWRGQATVAPLANTAVVAAMWPKPAPHWVWMYDADGAGVLVTGDDWRPVWRAAYDSPQLLCMALQPQDREAVAASYAAGTGTTRDAVTLRRRRTWIGIGTALLVGTAAGIGAGLAGGGGGKAGTVAITW